MRRLTAVLFLTLLLFLTVSAQKKTDRERDDLKGAVRAVRVEIAKLSNGQSAEGARVLSSVTTYDARGNKSELALYDTRGLLLTRTVYSHDLQANRPTGWTIYNAQNSIKRKVSYSYDDLGFLTQQEHVNYHTDNSILVRRVLSYKMGELIKIEEYNADGSPVDKSIPLPGEGELSPDTPDDDESRPGLHPIMARYSEDHEKDSQGNWVKSRIVELKNKPDGETNTWIFYRTISYY